MSNQPLLTTLLSVLAFGCVEIDATEDETFEVDETSAEVAIPACASGTWCLEPTPAGTATVHDIFVLNANEAFAVGDGGLIMRRQNNEWTQMASGTTASLRGVHGTSATNMWAVGLAGTALRFDGTAWSPVTVTANGIDAVWTTGSNIFMCGGSTIWRSANGGASFTTTNMTGSLFAISGVSASEVYVTGENAQLRKWNGSSWSTIMPGAGTSTYFSVLALAPGDVWVSDYTPSKETMHLVKSKWAAKATSLSVFQSMHKGSSVNDLWGVGGSKIGRFNGSTWTTSAPLGTGISLWSVSGTPGHVWAVGSNGTVAHYAY